MNAIEALSVHALAERLRAKLAGLQIHERALDEENPDHLLIAGVYLGGHLTPDEFDEVGRVISRSEWQRS